MFHVSDEIREKWGLPALEPKHCQKCGRSLDAYPLTALRTLKWCRDCAAIVQREKAKEYYHRHKKAQDTPTTEQEKQDMLRAALRRTGH